MKMNKAEQQGNGLTRPRFFEGSIMLPASLRSESRSGEMRGLLPRHVQAELDRMKSLLATRQKQLDEARKQNAALITTNTRLHRKLDILAEKVVQARHDACHDPLTGLSNRVMLMDRLNQAMARAVRQNTQVALLFLDLDGFKRINDTLGHLVGDKLLQQIAERLTYTVRATDTACRYGGDEFMLVLPDLDAYTNFESLKEKIHAALTSPYLIDEEVIYIKASMGVAIYPGDATSAAELVNQADIAMYRVKAS